MKIKIPILIRTVLLLAVLTCRHTLALAQSPIEKIDSLQQVIGHQQGKELVDSYNQISWNYRNIRIDSSLIYAQRAYHLAQSIQYTFGICESLNFIGISKRNHSNFLGALESFFDALKYAEQDRNLVQISYTLINIGNIYVFQTNYEGAIEYFEKALINANKLEDIDLQAYCYINLGRSYTGLKKYKKAEVQIKKAISLREQQNNLEGVIISQIDLSNLYVLSKRYDETINLIQEALPQINELGHITTLAYSYLNLAKAHLYKGDQVMAMSLARKSLEICKENDIEKVESDLLLLLSEAYENSNNLSKALHYQKLYLTKKDSIFSEENTRKIESLHATYAAEKKEAETRFLKQQAELNQIIIQRQKVIIWLSIVGLILFLGIALVSYKAAKDRKLMTQQIEKQKEEAFRHNNSLIDLNHEKNNLIRILSHDLRAPINNIKGLTQIHKDNHSFSEGDNHMLDHIVSESDRLLNMITKILNVEALDEDGKHQYANDRINLEYVIEQVLSSYKTTAKAKEILIHTEYSKEDLYVFGDQIHMHQILENLISNAIKFSERETKVDIKLTKNDTKGVIQIKDEGPGFTEDDLKKVFTKFQTLSAKPTANEQSTGLGLSIVKQYVEQMNGSIFLDSKEGQGTTFRVEFELTT